MHWPAIGAGSSCLVEEEALPFADLSFDRILLVHGLELVDHAKRLLREIWRVLKADGRLILVAPNRRGLWTHLESNPFGHGQPLTSGQLGRLLAGSLFHIERRLGALCLWPFKTRLSLRCALLWENPGESLLPSWAGVILVEAAKDFYAAVPPRATLRRRVILADPYDLVRLDRLCSNAGHAASVAATD